MKYITKSIAAQYLIGIVFFVSGISKALNIPKTALTVHEYFQSCSIELDSYIYDIAGTMLIGTELIISLFLFFNIFNRFTINITIVILVFFTGITFVIALSGKMPDCGCFGEQLAFTGWQSFAKNIILLLLSTYVAARQKETKRREKEHLWAICIFIGIYSLCLFGLKMQPIHENGLFKTGENVCMLLEDVSQPIFSIEQLRINKNGRKAYTNISDSLFCLDKYTVIGIIQNDNQVSTVEKHKLINSVLDISHKINGNAILTTSSMDTTNRIERTISIGISDKTLLSKIISTNIGIIVIKKCLIIKKCQRNAIGWQEFPKDIVDL